MKRVDVNSPVVDNFLLPIYKIGIYLALLHFLIFPQILLRKGFIVDIYFEKVN